LGFDTILLAAEEKEKKHEKTVEKSDSTWPCNGMRTSDGGKRRDNHPYGIKRNRV